MGFFITFEGGDGAGKSTQSAALAERLRSIGVNVILTREPGGTRFGEHVRRVLVGSEADICPWAMVLAFMAARAQLIEEVIRPSLTMEAIVISDRFIDSTFAYQGYAQSVNVNHIEDIHAMISNGLFPDVTYLIDIGPLDGLRRTSTRPTNINERFEEMEPGFHARVRDGYMRLAQKYPNRIRTIDGRRSPDDIGKEIVDDLFKRMKSKGTRVALADGGVGGVVVKDGVCRIERC
jgi:dTMP kinase